MVEDNKMDVSYFTKLLENIDEAFELEGIVVKICHTLIDALVAIKSTLYDVILLDLRLPDSDWLEGLREVLTATNRMVPIVVYSSIYNATMANEALDLGADEYVTKGTLTKNELVRTLIHARRRHKTKVALRELKNEHTE